MIYIVLINNELRPLAYTSLKGLYDDNDISYNNSTRVKRLIYKAGVKYEIKELEVSKIRGRGRRF